MKRLTKGRRLKKGWRFGRVAGPFTFTEGPVWDGSGVFFTDIPTSRILYYDVESTKCAVLFRETLGTNGLALDRSRSLYGCQSVGRRVVRYSPGKFAAGRVIVADSYGGRRLNSPNDLIVDSRGRVWFTDPRYGEARDDMELEHESVFRVDPRPGHAFEVVRVTFDTKRPNGLALSPDESILYVAESPSAPKGDRQLRAYPVKTDGGVGPGRILFEFGPHRGIDGMCIDATGHIVAACGWVRSGPGPRIAVFDPDGSLVEEHPIPAQPTNVCFGGPGLDDLYVTAYDGCLWRTSTHRKAPRTAV
jgi:gluconolactonase